ncbi:DUF2244 domain-containing protein [Sinirhodobacter sp. HNIBRBA609]|nr:DUF2244 domain-containing protein [Sinirhodobacter sp. HNIBRBA609]
MPYRWSEDEAGTVRLRLWPYRSLPRRGFVAFIGVTAGFLAVPLLAVLGSKILWALLPFLLATIWAIWFALSRSYRSGEVLEELTLSAERITLTHRAPRSDPLIWETNAYWVQPTLHPTGGRVPDYLTLRGGPREVEIGAFLTPEERRALFRELLQHLAEHRRSDPGAQA